MTETAALAVAGTPKVKSLKAKAKAKKASHPPTAALVINAIKHLNERGGSSAQAIKKYISSTYKIDAEKIAPLVKKYLKSAVEKGFLIRTKGTGASGSFKLTSGKVEGVKKVAKKPKAAKKTKPKKKVTSKKPKSKPKKAKKAPSKAKKATKAPAAKKPKAPKPKKASPKKVAKKVAAKK